MAKELTSRNIFDKAVSVISKYLFYLAAATVAASGLMTGFDVVARYIFSAPLPGVYQLQEMLLVTMIVAPLAYCQEKKIHIRVDVFLERLKGKGRAAFELAGVAIALVLFALVTWTTGKAAWVAWVSKDYYLGPIHYPYWPSKTMIPIGTGFLCLRLLIDSGAFGAVILGIKQNTQKHGTDSVEAQ